MSDSYFWTNNVLTQCVFNIPCFTWVKPNPSMILLTMLWRFFPTVDNFYVKIFQFSELGYFHAPVSNIQVAHPLGLSNYSTIVLPVRTFTLFPFI